MGATFPKMTLAEVRTAARQRADMVNSEFVTDSELTGYVNSSLAELYDLLVQKYGDDYFVADPHTITTDGSERFDLPDDFFKLLGVDLQLGNSQDSWVTLRPFTFADRNKYAVPNFQSFYGVTNLRYRLNGSALWFTPKPTTGQSIRVHYVPRVVALVNPTDEADGFGGWLEYVVVDAAIKMLQKEESDVSVLMAQKQGLIHRIEAAAENRDAGAPATVGDTQWSDYGWPSGGAGRGNGGAF